jgi:hypothetical protein
MKMTVLLSAVKSPLFVELVRMAYFFPGAEELSM